MEGPANHFVCYPYKKPIKMFDCEVGDIIKKICYYDKYNPIKNIYFYIITDKQPNEIICYDITRANYLEKQQQIAKFPKEYFDNLVKTQYNYGHRYSNKNEICEKIDLDYYEPLLDNDPIELKQPDKMNKLKVGDIIKKIFYKGNGQTGYTIDIKFLLIVFHKNQRIGYIDVTEQDGFKLKIKKLTVEEIGQRVMNNEISYTKSNYLFISHAYFPKECLLIDKDYEENVLENKFF